jgi:hypothetical protein
MVNGRCRSGRRLPSSGHNDSACSDRRGRSQHRDRWPRGRHRPLRRPNRRRRSGNRAWLQSIVEKIQKILGLFMPDADGLSLWVDRQDGDVLVSLAHGQWWQEFRLFALWILDLQEGFRASEIHNASKENLSFRFWQRRWKPGRLWLNDRAQIKWITCGDDAVGILRRSRRHVQTSGKPREHHRASEHRSSVSHDRIQPHSRKEVARDSKIR